jgi:acetyl/propionyl-CoA carboxylase alpha subunit
METHCYAGFEVSPYYDPLLAKLIVRGSNRSEAVRRLRSCLAEFCVEGVTTNIAFLKRIAEHPDFVSGDVHTQFIPNLLSEEVHAA